MQSRALGPRQLAHVEWHVWQRYESWYLPVTHCERQWPSSRMGRLAGGQPDSERAHAFGSQSVQSLERPPLQLLQFS